MATFSGQNIYPQTTIDFIMKNLDLTLPKILVWIWVLYTSTSLDKLLMQKQKHFNIGNFIWLLWKLFCPYVHLFPQTIRLATDIFEKKWWVYLLTWVRHPHYTQMAFCSFEGNVAKIRCLAANECHKNMEIKWMEFLSF